MTRFLIDTCILIDYMRDNSAAVKYLESLDKPPLVSSLTIAELYAGVREGNEKNVLDDIAQSLEVAPITTRIAQRGGLYRRDYHKQYGIDLVDALLAATAEEYKVILVTLNAKHFPMLDEVIVPY